MIKPVFNNVLVKQIKEERKTSSGIYLETTTDNSPTFKSTVIEVGDDVNLQISKGDTVVLSRYQRGTEVTYDNETYLILPDKDILAVIK